MANKISQRNNIMYNDVSDQRLTYANQLNVKSWNDTINILKTQANINASYLSTLHNWLVGESETIYTLNSDKSFIEYVSEDLATYKWVDSNYYKKHLVYTKDEALALGLIEIKEYNEETGEISLVYNSDLYDVKFDETTGNLIFTFKDNDVIKDKVFKISDPDMFRLSFKTVESLPTENISTSTIYLILNENSAEDNIYTEYIYSNNKWEIIGTTQMKLDNKLKLVDSGETNAQDGNIGWFEFAINKQLSVDKFYLIEISFYDYGKIKFILTGCLSHCLLVDYDTDNLIQGICEYTERALNGETFYILYFRNITTNYAMYCDGTYAIYEFPFSL